ncbi:MAG: NAD(P)-dependent oxidoreductase [Clostridia bacterium]|nr:NAD(P)-dependent oxidoreductase [Clostridia bacterium]
MDGVIEAGARAEYGSCIKDAAERIRDAQALKGARILVTGASGMIGGAVTRTLLYLNRTRELGLSVLCPVRSLDSAKSRLFGILGRGEACVFEADIESALDIDGEIDYILHAAAVTDSREMSAHPARTLMSSVNACAALLTLAREKQVRGMVYVSSMEAYGVMNGVAREGCEGSIDLSSPRSCYPESKRLNELNCVCHAREYGVKVCSARLAQTVGAGARAEDRRVFCEFARAALDGKALVLRTAGESNGNYVHISDCVSALVTLLMRGVSGETYNVCGDGCTLKIKQLAQLISDLLSGGRAKVEFDVPADARSLPYAPDTGIILDNTKLKALGWTPGHSINEAVLSLGADISELKSCRNTE